ncbi:sensor histidine kinase [Streptomyces mirabilis]|jgi:signal transduction histidine kinase|uniref:sensor histidine kinase n=1 Tax=Streptomyces TaxID=1883 RepID=UPI000BB12EB0|nr:sensor histidine kinase [Streptomyces sp. Ag82_O1-15]PBC99159.1 signal transduction histidine kinase [Streptomyces sp. Ag82_O1-15]
MHAMPLPPRLKLVPPGAWVALAWSASTAFTFLARVRLPGEEAANELAATQFYRWDGLVVLTIACALALLGSMWLHRRPLGALALLLTAAAFLTTNLAAVAIQLAQFLAVDLALYFIAAGRPRRTGVAALCTALAVLVGWESLRLLRGWGIGTLEELTVALTAVVAWLLGDASHRTREYGETLRARAATQAVTDERLRIAREMHDMVAHSIGIIALQAGAAARVVHTQPDAAREAMTAVETAGRETLSGLRRMLVALRHADQDRYRARAAAEADRLHPAEGLADLDRLAAATTAAGVQVDVHWKGARRQLPPDIDLSAFRIVQESITNVVRHAATPACRVTVDYLEEHVAVEVTDDGRGRGGTTDTGFGLVGMRERVALLHGEFTAGPRPEGGFRVTARLPVPGTAATVTAATVAA